MISTATSQTAIAIGRIGVRLLRKPIAISREAARSMGLGRRERHNYF